MFLTDLSFSIVSRYNPGFTSNGALGKPGIQPECFIFDEKNLVSLSGPSTMDNVFTYLKDRFIGNASIFDSSSNSMLRVGTELNDFLLDTTFNDNERGLLIAEFTLPQIPDLPVRTPDYSFVGDSKFTSSPCITEEDANEKLQVCEPNPSTAEMLTTQHCEDALKFIEQDIQAYARFGDPNPISGNTRRWPKSPLVCVWACGRDWKGYEQPVHVGLTDSVKEELLKTAKTWHAKCKAMADDKLNPSCIPAGSAGGISGTVKRAQGADYFQEVCGR